LQSAIDEEEEEPQPQNQERTRVLLKMYIMPIEKDQNFRPGLYQLKIQDNFNSSIMSLKEDPE